MNAKTNDLLRQSIPIVLSPNLLVITHGIACFTSDEVAEILQKVKDFDEFTSDNDPWGEHDFGLFDYKGNKIYWKIDDYAGYNNMNLVLTVLLAEEY